MYKLHQTFKMVDNQSVALNSSYESDWIDCYGYNNLSVTSSNDAATASSVDILWSNDKVGIHGEEEVILSSTKQLKAGRESIKAKYAKIKVSNEDGAAAHVFNTWVYLT